MREKVAAKGSNETIREHIQRWRDVHAIAKEPDAQASILEYLRTTGVAWVTEREQIARAAAEQRLIEVEKLYDESCKAWEVAHRRIVELEEELAVLRSRSDVGTLELDGDLS